MTHNKTVQMYLMDNTASGRVRCTLAYWTGVAYKLPHRSLKHCNEPRAAKDLAQSGVYFLFGTSDVTGKDFVYIGQAGTRKNTKGILGRLQEHHGEKDEAKIGYWNKAVAFTTTDDTFGPTEISYLEHRFYNLAKLAGRFEVKNGNEPNPGNVKEEQKGGLEEFIEHAQLVMGALGFEVFEPVNPGKLVHATPSTEGVSPVMELVQGSASAKGIITDNGFVVLKGSLVKQKVAQSCPATAKREREMHATKIGEDCFLTDDILFKSPNIAAGFVTGNAINAREAWKTAEGKTLNELENS